jgi:hypothetical protein
VSYKQIIPSVCDQPSLGLQSCFPEAAKLLPLTCDRSLDLRRPAKNMSSLDLRRKFTRNVAEAAHTSGADFPQPANQEAHNTPIKLNRISPRQRANKLIYQQHSRVNKINLFVFIYIPG